jgi:hypothetical protein
MFGEMVVNTAQWCILGVAASAFAVYVLATMGLVRAGRTIDDLNLLVEDLEDEIEDFKAIRTVLLKDADHLRVMLNAANVEIAKHAAEAYKAKQKLKRNNPRDDKGRFSA